MQISSTGIKRRGFTLIELMVALSISIILSGIVVVSIVSSMQDARMHSACRIVASMLNYARSRAASTGTSVRVMLNGGVVSACTATKAQSTSSSEDEELTPLTTAAGKPHRLPNGVTISGVSKANGVQDEYWVEFDNLGEAEKAEIELTDENGQKRYVLVDPITGRCRIQRNAAQKTF